MTKIIKCNTCNTELEIVHTTDAICVHPCKKCNSEVEKEIKVSPNESKIELLKHIQIDTYVTIPVMQCGCNSYNFRYKYDFPLYCPSCECVGKFKKIDEIQVKKTRYLQMRNQAILQMQHGYMRRVRNRLLKKALMSLKKYDNVQEKVMANLAHQLQSFHRLESTLLKFTNAFERCENLYPDFSYGSQFDNYTLRMFRSDLCMVYETLDVDGKLVKRRNGSIQMACGATIFALGEAMKHKNKWRWISQ